MSTKWRADGDVHAYFTPHASPYDAYISYMNVLRDLEQRLAAPARKAKAAPAARPTAVKPAARRKTPRAKPKRKRTSS